MTDTIYLRIYNKACAYLGKREYSVLELYKKLQRYFLHKSTTVTTEEKERAESLIPQVIEDLQSDKLLSNERFAEAFIRSKLDRYNGPLLIQKQLLAKGVTNDMWLDFWAQYENLELPSCLKALDKWLRQQGDDYKLQELQLAKKAERYLAGRGFYMHTVHQALNDRKDSMS